MANDGQQNDDLIAPPPHVPISQIKEQLEMQKAGKVVTGATPLPTPLSQQGYNPELANKKDNQAPAMQESAPGSSHQEQQHNPANVVTPTDVLTNHKEPKASEAMQPQENDASKETNTADVTAPTATNQAASDVLKDTNIKLLVWVQIVSLIIIAIAFVPPILWRSTGLMIIGLLIIGLAISLAIWAITSFRQSIKISPLPNKHGFLVTGGPYKYMRHPMYAALMMASLGLTLTYPTIPRVLALVALAIVLNAKINIEESKLANLYHHYNRYQHTSGKYWPKFKKPDLNNIDIPRFEK